MNTNLIKGKTDTINKGNETNLKYGNNKSGIGVSCLEIENGDHIFYDKILDEHRGDFYVAADGDDSYPGTLEKPFQTIQRARDAVRCLRSGFEMAMARPVIVFIRGGTYEIDSTIVFNEKDSGSSGCPVVYAAFPGEKPLISGGKRLSGWEQYEGDIYSVKLQNRENHYWNVKQLFWNGKRQIRARFPNFDPVDPHYGGWAFIESVESKDGQPPVTFTYEPGLFPRKWQKPEQGEVFIIPGLGWLNHSLSIRDIDLESRKITVGKQLTQRWDNLMKGNRFYVENILEELDQPGEWCCDYETGTIYFWPPDGKPSEGDVTVPIVERLIELRSTAGVPVRHIHFYGLSFTQTESIFPYTHPRLPEYVDCNRSNSAGYALYMENTEFCIIKDCKFDQVGGDAIRMHSYAGHHSICNNEITGSGGQAISFVYQDLWPYDFPPVTRGKEQELSRLSQSLPWAVGNRITDNHIHNNGVIDNFGAAIHIHGFNCDHNLIAHNYIHDQPHHAIYMSMCFGRNIIEYNYIRNLCYVMADAGGVYSNRCFAIADNPHLNKSSIIRYNFIREVTGVDPISIDARQAADNIAAVDAGLTKTDTIASVEAVNGEVTLAASEAKKPSVNTTMNSASRIRTPYFTWGIYFDNSPMGATVYGNITYGNVWGGVFLGGGYGEPSNCLVENNIFIESSVYQFDLSMNKESINNRFVRNIICYSNPEAVLLRYTKTEGIAECDYNLYYNMKADPIMTIRTGSWQEGHRCEEKAHLSGWKSQGFDIHSIETDPQFVNFEEGDFRLKFDSPAFKLGFKPIPVELIGIRRNK